MTSCRARDAASLCMRPSSVWPTAQAWVVGPYWTSVWSEIHRDPQENDHAGLKNGCFIGLSPFFHGFPVFVVVCWKVMIIQNHSQGIATKTIKIDRL